MYYIIVKKKRNTSDVNASWNTYRNPFHINVKGGECHCSYVYIVIKLSRVTQLLNSLPSLPHFPHLGLIDQKSQIKMKLMFYVCHPLLLCFLLLFY